MANMIGALTGGSPSGKLILWRFGDETGAKLWSYATDYWMESSPVVTNGVVYVGGDDFNVYTFGVR
jgi:outer membrane protein assembly factor BamB